MGEPARTLSETVRMRVQDLRLAKKWSQERLATELGNLGLPLHATAITRIEKGARAVALDEIPVFARALGVPPVLLLLPLGIEPTVEIFPGRPVPTWEAVKWWSGDDYLPTRTDDGYVRYSAEARREWQIGTAPLQYFRDHDQRIADLGNVWVLGVDPDDTSAKALDTARALGATDEGRKNAQWAATRLRDLRRSMRLAGIVPPNLPADLAYIDKGDGGEV